MPSVRTMFRGIYPVPAALAHEPPPVCSREANRLRFLVFVTSVLMVKALVIRFYNMQTTYSTEHDRYVFICKRIDDRIASRLFLLDNENEQKLQDIINGDWHKTLAYFDDQIENLEKERKPLEEWLRANGADDDDLDASLWYDNIDWRAWVNED